MVWDQAQLIYITRHFSVFYEKVGVGLPSHEDPVYSFSAVMFWLKYKLMFHDFYILWSESFTGLRVRCLIIVNNIRGCV